MREHDRLKGRAEEERTRTEPPPADWTPFRRMRWELFHNGTSHAQWPGSGLSVVLKSLRLAGYKVTTTKENGTNVYRAELAPAFPNGNTAKSSKPKPPKPQPVTDTPPLGANVVVFALLAHGNEVVVGFAERDGRQWFAILTEPPT